MKASPIQTNFTSGEVSPRMKGRVDVSRYQNGAEKVQNFTVLPQGGIERRTGFRYVQACKVKDGDAVLVPFEVSDDQSYMLLFGDKYIHFFKNREPLFETTTQECEFFTVHKNGNDIQLWMEDHNSPLTDSLPFISSTGVTASTGVLGSEYRIVFTQPHTLRTGCKVYITSTSFPAFNGHYTVERVDNLTVDLQGTVSVLGPILGITDLQMYFTSLLPGDKVYISGASNISQISEKYFIVRSVDATNKITLANCPITGFAITAVQDNGGGLFRIFTPNTDGLFNGDNVSITGLVNHTTANGNWEVTNVNPNVYFDLIGSAFAGAGAESGYWNHYPTMEELHCVPIELYTNYTSAELSELSFAQTADVLYIFHPNHPPAKLSRLSDDGDRLDWLLADVEFVDGPYLPLNDIAPTRDTVTPYSTKFPEVYLEISNYSHTATVLAATDFDAANDDTGSKYLEYRERDQWRLAKVTAGSIAPGTPRQGTVEIIENVLLYLDETTKFKSKKDKPVYNPGSNTNSASVPDAGVRQRLDPNNAVEGTAAAGNLTANFANTFGAADLGKFIRHGTNANPPVFYWSEIDGVPNTTGTKVHVKAAVTMVSNNATGKFVLKDEARTCTVVSKRENANFDMFATTDVGRMIRLGFAGRWTWGKITAYTNAYTVTVTLYEDIPRDPHNAANLAGNQNSATPTTGICFDWRLGAWSDTTGWPAVCEFHEQRLWAARTATQPQSMWSSRPDSFEDFSPTELDSTVLDDNAVNYTVVAKKVSPVYWLSSGATLLAGGLGYEWQGRAASSILEPITPTNILVTPQTQYGSKKTVRPQKIGAATLFVDRPGRKVREMVYDFQTESFIARDVSIIAEHILRQNSSALYSEFSKNPISTYWLVLGNGDIAAMTYEKDQEVAGWYRYVLGGDAEVCHIGVIPSADSSSDDVYVVTRRQLNGTWTRVVEILTPPFEPSSINDKPDMFFVDGGIQTIPLNFTTTEISGLNHLIGKSVYALVDGVEEGPFTVDANGVITGVSAADELIVGLHYDSIAKILPIEAGGTIGTAQVKIKRVNKVGIRVLDSLYIKHSSTDSDYQSTQLGDGTEFYSGDSVLNLEQGYDFTGSFYLKEDRILPLTILLVTPELKTREEG